MGKKYYTLVMYQDGIWCPEFGDYSRKVVAEEMADMRHANVGCYINDYKIKTGDFKIIASGDTQAEIDAAVAELNA